MADIDQPLDEQTPEDLDNENEELSLEEAEKISGGVTSQEPS